MPIFVTIFGSMLFFPTAAFGLVGIEPQEIQNQIISNLPTEDFHITNSNDLHGSFTSQNSSNQGDLFSSFGKGVDQVLFAFANSMAAFYYTHKNIRQIITIGKILFKFLKESGWWNNL